MSDGYIALSERDLEVLVEKVSKIVRSGKYVGRVFVLNGLFNDNSVSYAIEELTLTVSASSDEPRPMVIIHEKY